MEKNILLLGIWIFFISIVIYCIKNYSEVIDYCEKIKNKKITKVIIIIIVICIIILSGFVISKNIKSIIQNWELYKYGNEKEKMFVEYDNKIKEENEFYKNAINSKYENQNSKQPYIIDGFEYVEGTWDTGFVIQDEDKNQYVWVPCTNIKSDEIPILEKRNFANPAFISKDLCVDQEYEKFLISSLENGGFYISRYEIGKEDDKPVSKPNTVVWNSVTRNEAIQIIDGMYENINCELINGYAYDTVLSWINMNNDVDIYEIDIQYYEKEKIYTGRNSYKNIFDLTDNVMEITQENSYETVIVRGNSKTSTYKNSSRYSILENEIFFDESSILGFRTILYK